MAILQDQTKTHEQVAMLAELARLREENAKLKAGKARGLTLKVSAKGAVSVYGMGKWPLTLYPQQWEKVFGMREAIETFILENSASLSFSKEG